MGKELGKSLSEWKIAFAKIGVHYDTDEEYKEAIHNLVGYFEVLIEIDQQQREAKKEKDNQKLQS